MRGNLQPYLANVCDRLEALAKGGSVSRYLEESVQRKLHTLHHQKGRALRAALVKSQDADDVVVAHREMDLRLTPSLRQERREGDIGGQQQGAHHI